MTVSTIRGFQLDDGRRRSGRRWVILTSALKLVDVAVAAQVRAVADGIWHGGQVVEDLANNGVDIAPFHKLNNQVPGSLKNELKAVRAGIVDGTIPTLP